MGKLNLPKTIKMIITDFDGVITDNCVYIDAKGEISRKINYKDVTAFYLLRKNNFNIAIISGEKNSAIEMLKETFDLKEVYQKIYVKINILQDIIKRYNLTQEEYVYIGDDINDTECLEYAKYKITVPDAIEKIRNIEGIQCTQNKGGMGAFREVADCLIN